MEGPGTDGVQLQSNKDEKDNRVLLGGQIHELKALALKGLAPRRDTERDKYYDSNFPH